MFRCLCACVCGQCGNTGPYLTLTVAGRVAIGLCATMFSLVVCLVLYQNHRGEDVSISASELKNMFVGVAAATFGRLCCCRRSATLAQSGTRNTGSAVTSSGPGSSNVVVVELRPMSSVALGSAAASGAHAAATGSTNSSTPVGGVPLGPQVVVNNSTSGPSLKDASSYEPKSGWRTKLKIGLSFFQVSPS
jgi:hypothetical protein